MDLLELLKNNYRYSDYYLPDERYERYLHRLHNEPLTQELVDYLCSQIDKGSTGNFEPVYTHREGGRGLILKCRKSSYISFNEKAMGKKYTVSHWD